MAQAWSGLGLAARRADSTALRNEHHDLFIGLGLVDIVPSFESQPGQIIAQPRQGLLV